VQRCVTDWAGPHAQVLGVKVRLGVPCYAGDILTLRGRVVAVNPEVVVEVVGRCELGDHVTGRVRLGWAGS
jgi:hypothetical protein